MTSVNHWAKVIEAMVKLKFLRAFGRVEAGEKSQGWSCGEGEDKAEWTR